MVTQEGATHFFLGPMTKNVVIWFEIGQIQKELKNCPKIEMKKWPIIIASKIPVILFVSLIRWEHAGGKCRIWGSHFWKIVQFGKVYTEIQWRKVWVRFSGTGWKFGYSVIKIKLKYDPI